MPRRPAQLSGSERKAKPRGRPFPKGKSGNPGGQPKSLVEVKRLATENAEELWALLMKRARKGDKVCIVKGLEWALGKPRLAVEITGRDGKPLDLKASVKLDEQPSARTAAIIEALDRAGVLVVAGAARGAAEVADAEDDVLRAAHAAPDASGVPPPR